MTATTAPPSARVRKARPASRNARAKGVERQVQQLLWPGSRFAGNAHRPALEDQDLTGTDAQGRLWWGEVKNWGWGVVQNHGGPWRVLAAALQQCNQAAHRAGVTCKTFSVWWPPGSRLPEQRLVMYYLEGLGFVVVTLEQFARDVIQVPLASEG